MLSRTAALVVGVALAVFAFLATTQQAATAQAAPALTARYGYPPHPRDMVQIYGEQHISAGGEHLIYTVPSDRWLVVVPKFDGDHYSSVGVYSHSTDGRVVERFGGTDSEKAHTIINTWERPQRQGPSRSDGIGWTFKPGSQILIRNVNPSSNDTFRWSIFGYLTPL